MKRRTFHGDGIVGEYQSASPWGRLAGGLASVVTMKISSPFREPTCVTLLTIPRHCCHELVTYVTAMKKSGIRRHCPDNIINNGIPSTGNVTKELVTSVTGYHVHAWNTGLDHHAGLSVITTILSAMSGPVVSMSPFDNISILLATHCWGHC